MVKHKPLMSMGQLENLRATVLYCIDDFEKNNMSVSDLAMAIEKEFKIRFEIMEEELDELYEL